MASSAKDAKVTNSDTDGRTATDSRLRTIGNVQRGTTVPDREPVPGRHRRED